MKNMSTKPQNIDTSEERVQAIDKSIHDFKPDWDMIQPFHERIKELEIENEKLLQALAQPEQEHKPWCNYLNIMLTSLPPQKAKCNCKQAQPEQEPVAWMVRDCIDGFIYPSPFENPAGTIKGESKPLYTAPPSKPWVGLSDMEAAIYGDQFSGTRLVREIEGLLRERNT